MKPSGIEWIGYIPDDWEVRKGKFLFKQRNSRGNTKKLELLSPTQKYGVIPQSKYEELTGMKPVKLDINADLASLKTICNGDYCISLRSFQGGFEYSSYEGVVSPAYQVFYPTKLISRQYYKYLFKVQSFIDKINSYAMSLRDGKNISFEDFSTTYLPFPPLKTQQKIADYLDEKCGEIDATIAKQKESIEKLKAYKQSLISETVTKGLDKSAPLKPSGIEWIGDIPSHWEIKKLKYVAKLDPTISEFLSDNDIVSFAPMECLGEQTLSPYETEYGKVKGKYTYFANEDIIMAKVTPCFENGNIAIAKNLKNNVGFGSSELFVFRTKSVSNSFLMYTLYSEPFKSLAKSTMYGTGGLKRVSPNFILNYKIPLPPLKAQESIADYLDSKCSQIDKYITEKQNVIQKLDAYKKSLIFECVTGKCSILG